ncbi:auxin-responsive protein SAUR71-like [Malania oleifera]|uniref:auxin-responsive protein SAUR71-like n=1 Tax=Malania oleifera TaxID=397392 RepID=UPI0025AE3015|nr:auxin-responsive protein SAUR71-like [Malania oleifera]
MSRPSESRDERKRSMLRLKILVAEVQKGLSILPYSNRQSAHPGFVKVGDEEEAEAEAESRKVPSDVKEGHFAVLAAAAEGGEPKRFIIGLKHLTNPAFLRLLEQAKEEYGFEQTGPLAVPCRPEELQKILEGRRS